MKNELTSLPGYALHEYQLVLQPHDELCNKIIKVRKDFNQKYGIHSFVQVKPKITIVKFHQLQMMEERIKNRLRMVAMAVPPFKVDMKDYGCYPSHTIYIGVTAKAAIQMLIKHLKTARHLFKTNEHNPHFTDDCNITLARQLLPTKFEQAWNEYSHKHFTGHFIASKLLLLKKREGARNFTTIQSFDFMNMPVVTRQGQLFD